MENWEQMMTSAQKTSSNRSLRRGVSLLEVVVALVVISILMTLGLTAFNGQADDKNLRTAAVEIESLSGRARSLAFLKQNTYRIALNGKRSIVLERPNTNQEEDTNGISSAYSLVDYYDAKVDISIRRWGAKDDDWLSYDNKNPEASDILWHFSPTGLCEPVSIRLLDGKNWIVLHMDPLTGRVQEEESYIATK